MCENRSNLNDKLSFFNDAWEFIEKYLSKKTKRIILSITLCLLYIGSMSYALGTLCIIILLAI